MDTTQTAVKLILDRWEASMHNYDVLLQSLSDDQLQKEASPGKNRGVYLLGHLIAVHDSMFPLLNFGEKQYPELTKIFIESPDKAVAELPSVQELRTIWSKQRTSLKEKVDQLKAEDWFGRHTAVSEEDFAKEPHRNKLNIILTRTTHLAYHTGQMIYLK
ncbi:DinB family protein [Fluviicola sp.]|uniref:DinB family protein n=1 Tax=Fluviicola sp. TaxID=1917219 RepID=UPI0031DC3230